MKNVCLGMKGPPFFVVKPQLHLIPQLVLDQVQRSRLGDSQVVARENPDFHPAVQSLL